MYHKQDRQTYNINTRKSNMLTTSNEKNESCPEILRQLKIGESTQFDRTKVYSVEKAIQRLKVMEGLYFRMNSKNDLITVTRKEAVKHPATEEILKDMKVGEFYTKPLKREIECNKLISEIPNKVFSIVRDFSRGTLTITRIE